MVVDKKNRSLPELSADVATNPNSTAFVELAGAYRERGDLDRAVRLCLRGLERHPTHVEAHYELGRIYEACGERELALDQWSMVRQLAPDHLAACCSAVRLYLDEGGLEEAARELREAQELAPSDAVVQELWKRFRTMQRDGRDRRDAGELDELVAQHPGTVGILLVGANGKLTATRESGRTSDSDEDLARHLSGARAEAERVSSHLGLGVWKRMVVESDTQRLAIAPMSRGVLIVATKPDMPAGRATRVLERALEAAELREKGADR